MKLYTVIDSVGEGARVQLIALFGIGLIGGEIAASLERAGARGVDEVRMGWGDEPVFSAALAHIAGSILRFIDARNLGVAPCVSIVWSAGNTGFSAGLEVAEAEWLRFKSVLEMCEEVASLRPAANLRFFHFSSAGGVFEGQTHVSSESLPNPLRAYGELKLRQETFLQASGCFREKHVYRPSSVYGYSPKGRRGLIAALIANGVKGRVTQIFGSANTLRDYIPAWQIGRFISSEILGSRPEAKRGPLLLASGKPSSIYEIIRTVESIIGRKIYTIFDLSQTNALDNTYCHSLIPKSFQCIGIREGVQGVFFQWLKVGF